VILFFSNADTELLALRSVVDDLATELGTVHWLHPDRTTTLPSLSGVDIVVVRLLGGRRAWEEPFDALRVALHALKAGDADALCYVADAMINSQSQLVIDTALAKALPAMFATPENAAGGALASYGVSYYAFGRHCARQVQRVLQGARPADLPVEQIDRLHFAINLRSARALRLTVPASVLAMADQVIE